MVRVGPPGSTERTQGPAAGRRAPVLVLSLLLLLAPALAGCLAGLDGGDAAGDGAASVAPPPVPEDATLAGLPDDAGYVLRWRDVGLPLEQNVTIPEGVTLVRARAVVGEDESLFVHLRHAETGRRRCNTPYIASWEQPTRGQMTCSGVTAVDPLPTNWTVRVLGPETADLVEVELRTTPLDGPAALVDADRLSMPVHDLEPTTEAMVESFDGTGLYAEVTLPSGEGPWPTVLASSPYNGGYHLAGEPAMWEYFVHDWAKRGYAVVVADVRGTGFSGGCMEVWGPSEQQDQVALVEWVADQPWSDGRVGFYGQSYVGTTPVEAAVRAPDALTAIIAVAPVINAYDDWHLGGVPNGESVGSPVAYHQLGMEGPLPPNPVFYATNPTAYPFAAAGFAQNAPAYADAWARYMMMHEDPATAAVNVANGVCDATLTARANDPRALYTGYYEARNFSADAGEVEAAVMYTHGFEDPNVKISMAVPWFNALTSPKLGLFGHWTHQHPPRADTELLMLAWMDQHVKGRDLGLDALPAAIVRTNLDTQRTAEAWPPADAEEAMLWPDLGQAAWSEDASDGEASLLLRPDAQVPAVGAVGATEVVVEGAVNDTLHIAGSPRLRVRATVDAAPAPHVAAFLYDVPPGGADASDASGAADMEPVLVTWGLANLAHSDAHTAWSPIAPGSAVTEELTFLPTEHVVEPGHTLRLVVRGAHVEDWFLVQPGTPGRLTLHGGEDGTALRLPLAPGDAVLAPLSGLP